VVTLAARLWLGGGRVGVEVRLWHRFGYCLALMALLYFALEGTTEIVGTSYRLLGYASGDVGFRGSAAQFVLWQAVAALFSLLLVVAFWCFASGRLVAPRLIMLTTLTLTAGMLLVYTIGSVVSMIRTGIDASRLLAPIAAIPFVAVIALLTVAVWAWWPAGPAPRRRLWLGGSVAGALVLVVTQVWHRSVPLDLNLPDVTADALVRPPLLVGMLVALGTAAGRRRADWLFALAALAGVLVTVPVLSGQSGRVLGGAVLSTSLDVALVALAVACAWCGWIVARATRTAER
jgi:hypothetical protein